MTRKRLAVAAATVVAVAAVASGPAAGAGSKVTVGNNFFKPKSKTVSKGSTVTWVWKGGTSHNVTGMTKSGRVVFRSKTTSRKGATYRKRFRKAGSFRVICTIHSNMKMSLRVR